jgi:hypothetical protein
VTRGSILSDATNYLGGIADVLEVKAQRGALPHLNELQTVALYENDRQIHEVRYRQEPAMVPRYRVRIWPLGAVAPLLGALVEI